MIEFAAVIVGSYLIGSIPSGLILGKLRRVDVREYGSGKTGTTNVLRTLGKKAAAVAFVADILKGVVAVLLAKFVLDSPAEEMAAGFAAVAGHDWSVFIKFQGGRGVATSLGGLLAMAPVVGASTLAIFFLIVALSRYASLSSMIAALSAIAMVATFAALDRVPVEYLIYTVVVVALIVLQHRGNIFRLLSGTELKLGQGGEKRQPQ
ncbi:MAG: glycerol-3-phosphate 1-O-acyltransferase PlsY [Dehalococcoidia bacterium]